MEAAYAATTTHLQGRGGGMKARAPPEIVRWLLRLRPVIATRQTVICVPLPPVAALLSL